MCSRACGDLRGARGFVHAFLFMLFVNSIGDRRACSLTKLSIKVLWISLITFICFSDILSLLYRKKKVTILRFFSQQQKKTKHLLHILNPFKSHVKVSEHFALISLPKGNVSFFCDQGCFSYCPSVAMKKSLRVPCRKSKVGRSSGFCFQHIVMISYSSFGQLSGHGIR